MCCHCLYMMTFNSGDLSPKEDVMEFLNWVSPVLTILLMVFSGINIAACVILLMYWHGGQFLSKFLALMITSSFLIFLIACAINIKERQAVIPAVSPAPASASADAIPTAVVTATVAEEEEMKFGGILIKNPSKQNFSIMVPNENGEYEKWTMVNEHNEEVKSSWDEKYSLPAEDDEASFEGKVISGEKEYPFTFDSEVDHRSIKVLNI